MLQCHSGEERKKREEQPYRDHTVATYEGICLCDLTNYTQNPDDFVDYTKKALELIKEEDGLRFRRIQRFITFIVNTELISGGNYDKSLKVCNVDFSHFKVRENPEWYLLQYASLLVHESTHGFIAARDIPYKKKTRTRIERLCTLEEKRFLMRVRNPWKVEDLVSHYDERWLKRYWGLWSRLRLAWKRANEILGEVDNDRKDKA